MKMRSSSRRGRKGYVSFVMVLTTGSMLTLLMVSAYKYAVSAQSAQNETQLRTDYSDKEDEVLRAVVNIVPNRAIRAMQNGSNATASQTPLRWQAILSDALTQANARTSISASLKNAVGGEKAVVANIGDSSYATYSSVFDPIETDGDAYDVSSGLNRSLGAGFPVPLQLADSTLSNLDKNYPIISDSKIYGSLASGGVSLPVATYPKWNLIRYPEIRFGYCQPGELFVAKRNWWAFSMHLGGAHGLLGSYNRGDGQIGERDFIVSLYEIPSQLAISAEAFTRLGTHADGTPWQNANIQGGVFATRAQVESGMHVDRLMARRGLALGGDVTVGSNAIEGNPFTPGVREKYEITTGSFMPVAVASDSGRAAFVPINRGAEFFDRFAHASESNTLSNTTWHNYSVGALQCAMRLDITGVTSATNRTPTALRFQYYKSGTRQTLSIPLTSTASALQTGFVKRANENQSYNFGTQIVDVAYGESSKFYYKSGVTGNITFDNATFGDPIVGTVKSGYSRPSAPFEVRMLRGVKPSIAVYPERFPAFLAALGADNVTVNNSLVVNVDYTTSGINNSAYRPSIPCTNNDYGLLLEECDDLSAFTKGFSVVTNLRLYLGDDYNQVPIAPPAGSGLPSPHYPPISLFSPELRWGTDVDPPNINLEGQVGHLKGDGGGSDPVHLLDLKFGSETKAAASRINVNLQPITHPAKLPPITMMNWLIVVEERRKMFYTGAGAN